jgi:hypothetical protein
MVYTVHDVVKHAAIETGHVVLTNLHKFTSKALNNYNNETFA